MPSKLPRDISGDDLARRLGRLGYEVIRQTGSHMRLTRKGEGGDHHITVPRHRELKVGTLAGIISDVAEHLKLERDALVGELFH